jgi:hypothetical protein
MAPLFGESDKMKEMGQQMQNLSEQIGALQQQLAQKNTEVTNLQNQLSQTKSAAPNSDDAMKLQRAQNEINSLKQNLDMLQAQAKQATSAAGASTSSASSATPSGMKSSAASSGVASSGITQGAAQSTHGLSIGGNAWVTRAGGLPLRLRSAPSLDGNILDRLAPGTQMTLLAGPQDGSGHSWWHIRTTDGREGWVAGEDLRVEPD